MKQIKQKWSGGETLSRNLLVSIERLGLIALSQLATIRKLTVLTKLFQPEDGSKRVLMFCPLMEIQTGLMDLEFRGMQAGDV